jgi:hypothetical protein
VSFCPESVVGIGGIRTEDGRCRGRQDHRHRRDRLEEGAQVRHHRLPDRRHVSPGSTRRLAGGRSSPHAAVVGIHNGLKDLVGVVKDLVGVVGGGDSCCDSAVRNSLKQGSVEKCELS